MPGFGRRGGRQPATDPGSAAQPNSATGVYILLAALIAVAFLPGFDRLGSSEFGAYLAALLASAVGTNLAVTTAIYQAMTRRDLFQRRAEADQRRVDLRRAATGRILVGELIFYGLALSASVLLVLDVVLDGPIVGALAGLFAAAIVALWVIVPWRAARPSSAPRAVIRRAHR